NVCAVGPQRLSRDIVAIRASQNSGNQKNPTAGKPADAEFSALDKTEQMHAEKVLCLLLLHRRDQIRCDNAAPGLIARKRQRPRLILIQVLANGALHAQPFIGPPAAQPAAWRPSESSTRITLGSSPDPYGGIWKAARRGGPAGFLPLPPLSAGTV